jgi:hypothetical protein
MNGSTPYEKEILDYAARIGVQAKLDGVKSSQLEQLIGSLEAIKDDKLCMLVTASFAYRQAERIGQGYRMARIVAESMDRLYQLGGSREDARKLLGLAKWVYESIANIRVPQQGVKDFNEYVSLLIKGGSREDARRLP